MRSGERVEGERGYKVILEVMYVCIDTCARTTFTWISLSSLLFFSFLFFLLFSFSNRLLIAVNDILHTQYAVLPLGRTARPPRQALGQLPLRVSSHVIHSSRTCTRTRHGWRYKYILFPTLFFDGTILPSAEGARGENPV
jgi:hypothetical protein